MREEVKRLEGNEAGKQCGEAKVRPEGLIDNCLLRIPSSHFPERIETTWALVDMGQKFSPTSSKGGGVCH